MPNSILLLIITLASFVSPQAATAQTINYDFCTISAVDADATSPQIWGAAAVQAYSRRLLANPFLIDRPTAAFPLSYVALSHERDVQRCGGSLSSEDRSDGLIGDLLADVMSRWMMTTVAACAAGAESNDTDAGLCAAVHRQTKKRYDALRATVDTTAVYLTSHMGMALAAVVFDDPFWNQEYPEATHCLAEPCAAEVLTARLAYVEHYKTLYDKNNEFLGSNLMTVIGGLHRGCFVRGDLISVGSAVAAQLPFLGTVFGNIRDQTFAAALEVAASLDPREHPMIGQKAGLNVIQYDHFATFAALPAPLRAAEEHARAILASELYTWLFQPLGSLGWEQLAQARPSQQPGCDYPLLR